MREGAEGGGGGEIDEGELAALGEGECEAERAWCCVAPAEADGESNRGLDGDEADDGGRDLQGMGPDEAEIGGHADREEEEAEQQALEGLDVRLELVAVVGIGEQHAGGEGAERGREAGGLGDGGGAEDDEEGGRGKKLWRARAADGGEGGLEEEAPAEQDDGDGGERLPGREPGEVGGKMSGQMAGREQRQERDQGDEGDVLEEQDGEGVPPGRRGENAALAQHGQHDCGRGEGEAGAEDQAVAPGEAGEDADDGDDGGGGDQLAGAEAEQRLAHQPEPVRAELEPDQEEQHDDAEGRDGGDLADIADEAEPGGADGRAGEQVAEDAAEAEPPRGGDGDGDRTEQDDEG